MAKWWEPSPGDAEPLPESELEVIAEQWPETYALDAFLMRLLSTIKLMARLVKAEYPEVSLENIAAIWDDAFPLPPVNFPPIDLDLGNASDFLGPDDFIVP